MGKYHCTPPPAAEPHPRAPRERPPSGVHQTALYAANETRRERGRPVLSQEEALVAGRHAKSWDSHDLLIAYLWFNVLTQGIDSPVSNLGDRESSLIPPVNDQWGGATDSSPSSSYDSSFSSYDSGGSSSSDSGSSSSSSGGDL